MSEPNFYPNSGHIDGLVLTDNYKRAVYRKPPSSFYVEMIPPAKMGGSFSYGMRICPIISDRVSASAKSYIEYEVWRRWEDCLWFQETLEFEYSRLARLKRNRLASNKKSKKSVKGPYLADRAASFESLPAGLDPSSISENVHDFLPKLSKKTNLFRVSQATVDQRSRELQNLLNKLFSDSVPPLIEELRADRMVTDFFGFWRRDHDLEMKQKSQKSRSKSRGSMSASIFTGYFSASNLNVNDVEHLPIPALPSSLSLAPPKTDPRRLSAREVPFSAPATYNLHRKSSEEEFNRHFNPLSPASSSRSSSIPSSRNSKDSGMSITSISSFVVSDDPPSALATTVEPESERPSTGLESLPEDRELYVQIEPIPIQPRRRPRSSTNELQSNRNCQIFFTPPTSPIVDIIDNMDALVLDGRPSTSPGRTRRESWQTTHSGSFILEGLQVSNHGHEYTHRPSSSISSVATFMTDNSADAVIPRSSIASPPLSPTPTANLRRSLSAGSRRYRPMSLSSQEMSDDDDDFISSYFYDAFPHPSTSQPTSPLTSSLARPETALGHLTSSPQSDHDHLASFFQARSRVSAAASISTQSSSGDSALAHGALLSIKAALNNSIVVLRTPRAAPFADVRRRIYDKFVGQEGVPLSRAFTVAVLHPHAPPAAARGRPRADSLSSLSISDRTHMSFVTSQAQWECAVAALDGTKLMLRILDTPP